MRNLILMGARLSKVVFLLTALSVAACLQAQEKKPGPESPGPANTPPLNERLTAAAWDAFNKHNHKEATQAADQCIDEFLGAARRLQAKLEKEKVSLPTGKVNAAQKKQISENGLLNDVATCLFIKGRCLEKMAQPKEAKEVYQQTIKLSLGRCWDPNGWFWSPAEAAADRLELLK